VAVIEAKEAGFDEAQVSSLIRAAIEVLTWDHERFSAAMGVRLSPDQVVAGTVAAGKIDAVAAGKIDAVLCCGARDWFMRFREFTHWSGI
jgi:hypothetical protein